MSLECEVLVSVKRRSNIRNMPGVFSKSIGWVVSILKTVAKLANTGKRGCLFVWQDETGLRLVFSFVIEIYEYTK